MINIASEGKTFERAILDSFKHYNIFAFRLKDNPVAWNQQGSTSFAQPNICDMVAYSKPIMMLLEMKSTKGTSFAITNKIIKDNQIRQLTKASEYEGIIPGFIFNFRNNNSTYFVHIKNFNEFRVTSGKKSINQKDCEQIGIKIRQSLKKVNWHYHIDEFIQAIGY